MVTTRRVFQRTAASGRRRTSIWKRGKLRANKLEANHKCVNPNATEAVLPAFFKLTGVHLLTGRGVKRLRWRLPVRLRRWSLRRRCLLLLFAATTCKGVPNDVAHSRANCDATSSCRHLGH